MACKQTCKASKGASNLAAWQTLNLRRGSHSSGWNGQKHAPTSTALMDPNHLQYAFSNRDGQSTPSAKRCWSHKRLRTPSHLHGVCHTCPGTAKDGFKSFFAVSDCDPTVHTDFDLLETLVILKDKFVYSGACAENRNSQTQFCNQHCATVAEVGSDTLSHKLYTCIVR